MATDTQARNRNPRSQDFLGDIGLDIPIWEQNLWIQVKTRLQALQVDPDPPSGITGLTITKNNLGNLVSWNPAIKANGYQVFRNTSNDITSARIISELSGNGNISAFDGIDQLTTAQTRYYWVRGVNASGLPGPFSSMSTSTNFVATSTGTAVGVDAIAGGVSGTAVGRNADSGTGTGNTVVGVSSVIAAGINSCTLMGQGITMAGSGHHSTTLVGQGINSSSKTGVAIGAETSIAGENDIAIGYRAATGSGDSNIMIGRETIHSGTGTDNVMVGTSCSVTGGRSTGIGQGITIAFNDCVVIGKGGTATANSQVIIGTIPSPIVTIWFGRGTTHTGAAQTTEIHSSDGSGTNIAGDHLAFYTGAGTGSGVGGTWSIYQAAAGSSGSSLNSHSVAASLTPTGSWTVTGSGPHVFGGTTSTRFLMNITGSLTLVGAASGAGLRVDPTLTAVANQDVYMAHIGGIMTKVAGTHAVMATQYLAGTIAGASGTVTESAQLYIPAALSGGSSTYAIRVAGGKSYFSGQLQTDTAGVGLGTAPEADAIITMGGTFSGSSITMGLLCATDLGPAANTSCFGARFTLEFDSAGSGTHPYVAALRVEAPGAGDPGGAGTTICSTVQILDAPTLGTTNYALDVTAGAVHMAGTIVGDSTARFLRIGLGVAPHSSIQILAGDGTSAAQAQLNGSAAGGAAYYLQSASATKAALQFANPDTYLDYSGSLHFRPTAGGGTQTFTLGTAQMSFFNASLASQQTSGANLTNNVTAGGTDDTIADFTSLTVYATDAAAIRNDIYQLARKLKQVNDGLRTYGIFT